MCYYFNKLINVINLRRLTQINIIKFLKLNKN